MASFVYNSFVSGLLDNGFDFGSGAQGNATTDIFRIAIVDLHYKINVTSLSNASTTIAGSTANNTAAQNQAKKDHTSMADVVEIGVGASSSAGVSTTNYLTYANYAVQSPSTTNGLTLPTVTSTDDGSVATTRNINIAFSNVTFQSATIPNALGGVLYKYDASGASASKLIAFLDFGGTVTSTAGDFTVSITTPLIFKNPAGA